MIRSSASPRGSRSGVNRRLFLSYAFRDEPFVLEVSYHLSAQPTIDTFCYSEQRKTGRWSDQIDGAIASCSDFVLFAGASLGSTQKQEWISCQDREIGRLVVALVRDPCPSFTLIKGYDPVRIDNLDRPAAARDVAREIVRRLGLAWCADDDLPVGYPFDYEKSIIEAYLEPESGRMRRIESGVPLQWPNATRLTGGSDLYPNPIPDRLVGAFRDHEASIVVDARTRGLQGPPSAHLTLPEACPRAQLLHPRGDNKLTVGIVVSGGVAPGTNAVIAGIVRQHQLYHHHSDPRYVLTVDGLVDGFRSLLIPGNHPIRLNDKARRIPDAEGGSILGTSRTDDLLPYGPTSDPRMRQAKLETIVSRLQGVDILYVIGGDGSMRAAHAIWWTAQTRGLDLSVVGVPKTMDNDVLWSFRSLGFASAAGKAREVVVELETEASSNSRVYVVQLFGSDSGFIVCDVALSTRLCTAILFPETQFSMKALARYVCSRLTAERDEFRAGMSERRPHAIILMAETAIPTDVDDYLDAPWIGLTSQERDAVRSFVAADRRVQGHTPDNLRPVGLKIVSRVLQREIKAIGPSEYWAGYQVCTNEPRHSIRAVRPSVLDVVTGQRLGALAVDNAMAGYTDVMISQWLNEYVLVPLKLVTLGRKRVPPGYFWRAAVAATGQPDPLLDEPARR